MQLEIWNGPRSWKEETKVSTQDLKQLIVSHLLHPTVSEQSYRQTSVFL